MFRLARLMECSTVARANPCVIDADHVHQRHALAGPLQRPQVLQACKRLSSSTTRSHGREFLGGKSNNNDPPKFPHGPHLVLLVRKHQAQQLVVVDLALVTGGLPATLRVGQALDEKQLGARS
jgi:hypothetical protein